MGKNYSLIFLFVCVRSKPIPNEIGVWQRVHYVDFSCHHFLSFAIQFSFVDDFHSHAFCKEKIGKPNFVASKTPLSFENHTSKLFCPLSVFPQGLERRGEGSLESSALFGKNNNLWSNLKYRESKTSRVAACQEEFFTRYKHLQAIMQIVRTTAF